MWRVPHAAGPAARSRGEVEASSAFDGKAAGPVGEFKIGVRREMWVYLLLAVLLVTTFEWLTYHRRVTV